MHIPDNYLSPQTCAVMTAAMVPVWTISVRKVRAELSGDKLPLLGVGAAFSFLGMMFNIPLPGGTTGHAVGGTLTALMVGPFGACISISVALLLQALLFGDGGILAFGANCFNMAFIMPFLGYAVYRLIAGAGKKGDRAGSTGRELAGAVIGAYAGINAAALAAAVEFGIQPLLFRDASGNAAYCPYPLSVSIPAMMVGHLTLFGLAEAVYTAAIFLFLQKTAPASLQGRIGMAPAETPAKAGKAAVPVLLGILMIGTPLGLLAEGTAWGEWGTEEIAATGAGFTPSGMLNGFSFETLLPDYSFGSMPAVAGYLLSALIGVAILLMAFRILSAVAGSHKKA